MREATDEAMTLSVGESMEIEIPMQIVDISQHTTKYWVSGKFPIMHVISIILIPTSQ